MTDYPSAPSGEPEAAYWYYLTFSGRDIVDFLATELERNIALELKQPDQASIPEKICR